MAVSRTKMFDQFRLLLKVSILLKTAAMCTTCITNILVANQYLHLANSVVYLDVVGRYLFADFFFVCGRGGGGNALCQAQNEHF